MLMFGVISFIGSIIAGGEENHPFSQWGFAAYFAAPIITVISEIVAIVAVFKCGLTGSLFISIGFNTIFLLVMLYALAIIIFWQ